MTRFPPQLITDPKQLEGRVKISRKNYIGSISYLKENVKILSHIYIVFLDQKFYSSLTGIVACSTCEILASMYNWKTGVAEPGIRVQKY